MLSAPLEQFVEASVCVDYDAPLIRSAVATLAQISPSDQDYCRAAFEFVRDEVPHTANTNRQVVTVKASHVLSERTGICHAKANLLAALLRAKEIPAGFGFQHLTLADDDSEGYCLHGFVVAFLGGRWIPLDPRPGTEFSLVSPQLAFPNRPEYDEYILSGVWAEPDSGTMTILEQATCLDEALRSLPEFPSHAPVVTDFAP
ncbi:MAG: hypothetical protein LBN10_10330 [Propionibacteriaceae bacterium]|jgi:transglutaminase-like putative cysteine protease|nr:hypothetical protein [Propionibacteriaceae bacterium]